MTLGDNSQPSWDEAPEWQRNSAVDGVVYHLTELSAGRKPSPAASHEKWMEAKLADGWKHEPIKQGEMVYRPCGFPFNRYSRVHQACIDKLKVEE